MAIVVEHDKRKQEILQKSLDVFIEEGYEDATFQKIADRCGITRTTLYIYFKNKHEIFLGSIKELLAELENALKKIMADSSLTAETTLRAVLSTLENKESHYAPIYPDDMSLNDKIVTVAKKIYGADGVQFSAAASKQLAKIEEMGFKDLPVCMAKTQYSLSDDPTLLGRPTGYLLQVREAYVSAGAGFVVALTGTIMTMPGLPKEPAAFKIDVNDEGKIVGLF